MFDKVYLLGIGGGGSHLAPVLVQTLRSHPKTSYSTITFIDGDKFEKKNQSRQLMEPSDVGLNKATSVARICEDRGFSDVYSIEDYANFENLVPLLEDAQSPLVIACVDNNATRAAIIDAIQKVCIDDNKKNFFFITPGNSDATEDPKGQVCWWGAINGKTYGQNPKEYDLDIQNPDDFIPRIGGCMDMSESHPQVLSANHLAVSLTLSLVQTLLDEKLDHRKSQIRFNCYNLTTAIS
jgi:hypothetical protein